MIVDTSALVAILADEHDGPRLLEALLAAERPRMSAATLLEAGIVVGGRAAPQQRRRLDELIEIIGIEIVPFDREQAEVARLAYRDFGRGSGHRARLNLGDCFSYALATSTREPLLFKGDDFGATGIQSALD